MPSEWTKQVQVGCTQLQSLSSLVRNCWYSCLPTSVLCFFFNLSSVVCDPWAISVLCAALKVWHPARTPHWRSNAVTRTSFSTRWELSSPNVLPEKDVWVMLQLWTSSDLARTGHYSPRGDVEVSQAVLRRALQQDGDSYQGTCL